MAASRKVPAFHAHRCLGCGRRYADTCKTPLVNARCMTCRTGQPPTVLDRNHEPVACCLTDSKLIKDTDTDTLERYALGGLGPWWKCKTCSRCQPFNPKEMAA